MDDKFVLWVYKVLCLRCEIIRIRLVHLIEVRNQECTALVLVMRFLYADIRKLISLFAVEKTVSSMRL